nr:conserved hypothetical protein [uncultured archaeon GZfos9D8]
MKMKERKKTIKPFYFLIALSCIIILMFIVPANAGVSPEEGRSIGDIYNRTAITGETNLSFVNETGVLIPEGIIKGNEDKNSDVVISFKGPFNSHDYEDELVPGEYKVIGEGKETVIYFESPTLKVKTKIGDKEVSKVTKGDNITFEAITNLWVIKGPLPNYINYKLIDPRGVQLDEVDGVSLTNIDVSKDGKNSTTINTATLEIGTYTLSIETDPATNNGLDKEGPERTFTVEERGVIINAEPTKQVVNKDIVFAVSTSPDTQLNLNVTLGIESNVWFKEGVGDVKPGMGGHSASGISDKHGNFTAVAYFTYTGSYVITATELCANTTDTVKVEIIDFSASVETDKSVYYIGEPVEITGSANAGDSITIKVDDTVLTTAIAAPTKKFTYPWTTTEDVIPSSYKIGIWVLPRSDPGKDVPDASTSILFIRGGLSAELIKTGVKGDIVDKIVAQGDDFEIIGLAPGRDNVDILTIAPKGGSGRGFDPADILKETGNKSDVPGLTHAITPVSDEKDNFGEFIPKRIDVDKNVDTGTYQIAVLNPGRDGVYGTSGSGEIVQIICGYDLLVKTQEQILAIIKGATIDKAGSDDLLWIGTIKVENPSVTLDDIEDVYLGDDIIVTGGSNRKEGFPIIITVEGPTELRPQIASIEGDTFTASFNTISAKVGKYTVTVDDGDGHTDTKTVNILPGTAPSFNISNTSAAPTAVPQVTNESATVTQIQTPTSTPVKAKKQPGFETIFIIAGILVAVSVARLKIRKRREQGEKKEKKDED